MNIIHCMEEMNEVQKKILTCLFEKGRSVGTLEIAKFCGLKTTKEVNPTLYGLLEQGWVAKVSNQPPFWEIGQRYLNHVQKIAQDQSKERIEKNQKNEENKNTKKEERGPSFEEGQKILQESGQSDDDSDEVPVLEEGVYGLTFEQGQKILNECQDDKDTYESVIKIGEKVIARLSDDIYDVVEIIPQRTLEAKITKMLSSEMPITIALLTPKDAEKLELLMSVFKAADVQGAARYCTDKSMPDYTESEVKPYLIENGEDLFNQVWFFTKDDDKMEMMLNQRLFSRRILAQLFWQRAKLSHNADNFGIMNHNHWFLENTPDAWEGCKLTSLLGEIYHDKFEIFKINNTWSPSVECEESFYAQEEDVIWSNKEKPYSHAVGREVCLTSFVTECALNNIFHVAVLPKMGLEKDIAYLSHKAVTDHKTMGVLTVIPNMIPNLKTGIYRVTDTVMSWALLNGSESPMIKYSVCSQERVLIMGENFTFQGENMFINEIFTDCQWKHTIDLGPFGNLEYIQFKLFDKNVISCCATKLDQEKVWVLHIWRDSGVVKMDNAWQLSTWRRGSFVQVKLTKPTPNYTPAALPFGFTTERLNDRYEQDRLRWMLRHQPLKSWISNAEIDIMQSFCKYKSDSVEDSTLEEEPNDVRVLQPESERNKVSNWDISSMRRMYGNREILESVITTSYWRSTFININTFKDFALTNKGAHTYNGNQSMRNDNSETMSQRGKKAEEELFNVSYKRNDDFETFGTPYDAENEVNTMLKEAKKSSATYYQQARKWEQVLSRVETEANKKIEQVLNTCDEDLSESFVKAKILPEKDLKTFSNSDLNKSVVGFCTSTSLKEEKKYATLDTEIDPPVSVLDQFIGNEQFVSYMVIGRTIIRCLRKVITTFYFRPDCLKHSDRVVMIFTEACVITASDTFNVNARQLAILGDAYLTSHIARRFLLFGEKNLTKYQNKRSRVSSNKNLGLICDKLTKNLDEPITLPVTQGMPNDIHKATMVEALTFLIRVFCTNQSYSAWMKFVEEEPG